MSGAESEATTTTAPTQSRSSTSSTSSQHSLRTPDPPTAAQPHLFYQGAPYANFSSYAPPFGSTGDATWSTGGGGLDTTSYLQTMNSAGASPNQTPLMTNQVLAGGLNPSSFLGTGPILYPNVTDYSSLATATVPDPSNFPYAQFGLFPTTPVIPGAAVAMPAASMAQKAETSGEEGTETTTGIANGAGTTSSSGNEQIEASFSKMSVSSGDDKGSSEGGGTQDLTSSTQRAPTGGGPKSWAAIASQPAKQGLVKPKSKSSQQQVGFGPPPSSSSAPKESFGPSSGKPASGGLPGKGRGWSSQRRAPTSSAAAATTSAPLGNGPTPSLSGPLSPSSGLSSISVPSSSEVSVSVLDRLRAANQYNPKEFNIDLKGARFFVIKSYSEDDIHRSIKYSIWTSTPSGNSRLDRAFQEQRGNPVYLLYSVNGSGHFCGVAEMTSPVDYNTNTGVFTQEKWKGRFDVKWIYVKDVPNNQLRHIRLENNENKPVTNSRDTQEVMPDKGKQILRIVHNYKATTSIFDDFGHYEKRQEEAKKTPVRGASAWR